MAIQFPRRCLLPMRLHLCLWKMFPSKTSPWFSTTWVSQLLWSHFRRTESVGKQSAGWSRIRTSLISARVKLKSLSLRLFSKISLSSGSLPGWSRKIFCGQRYHKNCLIAIIDDYTLLLLQVQSPSKGNPPSQANTEPPLPSKKVWYNQQRFLI